MNRGNLVIIDFRPVNPALGVRPALILQNDRDNARMRNTIVAQVTTNISRSREDTQYLIDQTHADWTQSGLHKRSVVNCSNIYTVHKGDIAKVIGSLSEATMDEIHQCLKAVFDMH